ncbi:ADP-ribosylglycohydrolase family protein [uncultured Vagococcus sp.]|uniref:ADP-ribosylglycohydrolase family protein n=1 Tax=uncultured Vagococcus sp. TaxID=189676 RepID=UPI0028D49524|nr:ADP-ribosylglycohydrolase family protein [uncultured Vagococcus sp.]
MLSFEDKVAGVFYGTAYGDALGATIEKLTAQEIEERYGYVTDIRNRWYKESWPASERNHRMRGNGIITDDTLMTMALMDVYIELARHVDAYDMGSEFVKQVVYTKRYIPEFGREATIQERLFYPEQYIFMRHVLANCEPREGGIGNMINCGAAMYIAPIGIVNAGNPKAAYNEAILFAQGHQASYGLEAAAVLAACVAKAFEEEVTIEEIVEVALNLAKDGTKAAISAIVAKARGLQDQRDNRSLVIAEFQRIMKEFSPMEDDVHRKVEKLGQPSNHYTPSRLFSIEELPMALGYLVLHQGEFKKAVQDGVNSGRDTDSIGVMVGVIAGAMHGKRIISENDCQLLGDANKIAFDQYVTDFSQVAKQIIQEDIEQNKQQEKLLR